MTIGPRSDEEEKLNAAFEKAVDVFRNKMPHDVELLVVAKRGDGILINCTGCAHKARDLAVLAAHKLHELADEEDRAQAEKN